MLITVNSVSRLIAGEKDCELPTLRGSATVACRSLPTKISRDIIFHHHGTLGQAMKLLLQSISKSSHELAFKSASCLSYARQSSRVVLQLENSWVCQQCRRRSQILGRSYFQTALTKYDHQSSVTKLEWHGCRLRRASTSNQTSQSHAKIETTPSMPREDLPSQEEGRRSQVSKRFSHIMDNVQSNIFIAGQRLNDLTGYSGIETLKKDIEEQGSC